MCEGVGGAAINSYLDWRISCCHAFPVQHPVSNLFRLNIRRDNILEDSFSGIMNVADVELLKSRLWIEFEGERGYDYGGVSRSA